MAQLFRRIAGYTIASILILICLMSIPEYIAQGLSLFRLDEAGYGDSYILYDVLQFQKTGRIYRNLAEPPFLPAQYSPLVYVLYSLPGRVASWENPFVAPRLTAIAAFLACLCRITSIVRVLFRSGMVWVWGCSFHFQSASYPSGFFNCVGLSRTCFQSAGDSRPDIRFALGRTACRGVCGICSASEVHIRRCGRSRGLLAAGSKTMARPQSIYRGLCGHIPVPVSSLFPA